MIQPRKWSVPLGSGADVQDLPDDDLRYASFSKIFPQITQVPLPAGGVAPRRIDFNSLFKLLADNIYFYQNGGVFEYSDTADYERGAFVKYNNKLYLCIQDNSSFNKHAPTDAEYWLRITTTADSPTGEIKIWTSSTVPEGYLLCNGSAISRSTYAQLFEAIGTIYGAGDGETTFNLPDLRDRFIEGAGSNALGTYLNAGLPNIQGSLYIPWASENTATIFENPVGAFYNANGVHPYEAELARIKTEHKNNSTGNIWFSADKSQDIYGSSTTVQPKSLILNAIIKY